MAIYGNCEACNDHRQLHMIGGAELCNPCFDRAAHERDCPVVAERDAARAEIARLRKLLFFRHGCPTSAMYGDDGEMQCQACFVDFRRMSAEDIEATWSQTALLALAAAKKVPTPMPPSAAGTQIICARCPVCEGERDDPTSIPCSRCRTP